MTKSSHTTRGGNVWTTYPQTYGRSMKWLRWNRASRVLLSAGNELAHLQRGVRECLLWLWVGASWTDSRSVSTYIINTVAVTYAVIQSEPEIRPEDLVWQPISVAIKPPIPSSAWLRSILSGLLWFCWLTAVRSFIRSPGHFLIKGWSSPLSYQWLKISPYI